MKNMKGFTLIEVLIASIIMVIVITSTITFIVTGYSLSNKAFALAQAQNKLNVIQEQIYYAVRSAGLIKVLNPKSIEIYDNSFPKLAYPSIILKNENKNLEMYTGNGFLPPSKSTTISADCDFIDWSFDMPSKNEVVFNCTIRVKKGHEMAMISNSILKAHYRSIPVSAQ